MNKMFSKKLFSFSILFYVFNLTFSIPHELIQLGSLNPENEDYTTKICNISINLWAGFCELSMKQLRSEFGEYSNLYVNYNLFNHSSPKCDSVTIRYAIRMEMTKTVLYCYGRPSVVQDNVLPLYYKHFKEIAILPLFNVPSGAEPNMVLNEIYIFKRLGNPIIYIHITQSFLIDLRLVPNDVLVHPPPTSVMTCNYDDFSHTYSKNQFQDCFNMTNVLQIIELNEFMKLCVWMFGQERFKGEFTVSPGPFSYGHWKKHERNGVYFKNGYTEGFVYTKVYYCIGNYIGPVFPGTRKVQYKYALALTHTDDSVMLCKTVPAIVPGEEVSWEFHTLEIVKNLDEKYLKCAP